jgi:hypothetical protein
MIPTQSTLDKINQVNQMLIDAKYILIEAENQAVDIREKTDIKAVQVHIQAGIKEILRTFYPKQEFNEIEYVKRRSLSDLEHNKKIQKILDDAVSE